MKLRELVYLCDPEMEIKIIVQKKPLIPFMTVRKLIFGGEYAYLLDREINRIYYCNMLKPWFRFIRTLAVWVDE